MSTSPGEPAFYLHHAMIDRVWWIWQMLSPRERQFSDAAIAGTNTFLNMPPSDETTLDDIVDLGFAAGPPMKIRDLLSITDGPVSIPPHMIVLWSSKANGATVLLHLLVSFLTPLQIVYILFDSLLASRA